MDRRTLVRAARTFGHRFASTLETAPRRRKAGAIALDKGRMSLLRCCPRCHFPMMPRSATAGEDQFDGHPVSKHIWRCDRSECRVVN